MNLFLVYKMYSIETVIRFVPNYKKFDLEDYKYILLRSAVKPDLKQDEPLNIDNGSIREKLPEELKSLCDYLDKTNENEYCKGDIFDSQCCNNCDTITSCSHCESCKYCEKSNNCENSYGLLKCKYVKDSSKCYKCTSVKNCYKCKKSKYLNKCSECKDCKDCLNCHGCKLCYNCINCVDCENCIGCFNCVGLRNTCATNFGKLFI